jgi:hypothetical protein
MGTGSRKKPASSDANDDGDSSDTEDPTLHRLRTKDSLASGAMSRDDGELTAKLRKREKVSNVESTKQLPTSKTDSKFQGSLLQSSVSSISDVGEKAHLNLQNVQLQPKAEDSEKENAEAPVKEENEARFKARQLMLNASPEEHPKNAEPPRAKAASAASPSPSPGASASPSRR